MYLKEDNKKYLVLSDRGKKLLHFRNYIDSNLMLPVENDLRTFPQFPICIHHLIFTKLESLMCSRGRHTYIQ